jgi:hypothetical protein
LRQQLAQDPTKFYTFSKEYFSLAFPLVNENEILVKEKQENEKRWKTKNGFDYIMKTSNWNEHPKKPDDSTIQNILNNPYHEEKRLCKEKMQGFNYNPADDGKPDF